VFVFVEIKYFVSQTRTLLKVYRYLAIAAFWPPLLYSLSYWKSVVKQTTETAGGVRFLRVFDGSVSAALL
jgi:hypothetical protein